MIEVPQYWVIVSSIYFCVSILWSIALIGGMVMLYKKAMPAVTEARVQVQRIGGQARSIVGAASNVARVVRTQTQRLVGGANSAGTTIAGPARAAGSALSGVLVAAKVLKLVRRIF